MNWFLHGLVTSVIFSDESRFTLQMADGRTRVYRRPGERYNDGCVIEVNRFHRGVMVWGAITANEKIGACNHSWKHECSSLYWRCLRQCCCSLYTEGTGTTNLATRQRTSSCCSNFQRISTGAQRKHIKLGGSVPRSIPHCAAQAQTSNSLKMCSMKSGGRCR